MRFRGTFTAPLVVIVVMFLVGASRFLDLAALSFHENICLAVIVIELVTIVVPTVFYARLRGDRFVSRMRLRAFGPDKLFVIILAAVTLFFADVLLKLGLHAVGAVSEDYSIYTYYFRGCTCPPDFPVCVCGKKPSLRLVNRKPILPSERELDENPRSRSAKLRVAEKLDKDGNQITQD